MKKSDKIEECGGVERVSFGSMNSSGSADQPAGRQSVE